MPAAAAAVTPMAWWREPTKDQWYAYLAAWAGWTLDAFDFTAFLLIIAPIAKEFNVPVPEVAAVFTVPLGVRLGRAPPTGGPPDRRGPQTPPEVPIPLASVCKFPAPPAPAPPLLLPP